MDPRGPAFPFAIDPATGQVAWSEGSQKLRDNVRIILSTRYGERPMNRGFGTQIPELLHEPNDGGLGRLVAKQAREALMQLEPRIVVSDLRVEQHAGEVALELQFIHSDRPQADAMVVHLG